MPFLRALLEKVEEEYGFGLQIRLTLLCVYLKKKEKEERKNVSYFTPNLRFDFDFAVLTIQGSDITLCL